MAWIEKDFEEKMVGFIDNIYRQTFTGLIDIYRSNRSVEDDKKMLFMDKEMAIDTFLTFSNGSIITLQEKTLKPFKASFQQFTFEYYNNPETKEKGEWFKLAAQLYFFGYAGCGRGNYDRSRQCKGNCENCSVLLSHCNYWIIDIPMLRLFLNKKFPVEAMIKNKWLHKNPLPAKATFWGIPFRVFPDELFLVKKDKVNAEKLNKLFQ